MGLPDPLLLGQAPAPVAATKRRSPWVAGLLALLCPGLGHFYCGALRAGLLWSVTPHLALMALLLAGVFDASHLHRWAAAGIAAWIGLRLLQAALAARRAQGLTEYRLRPLNHPALYVAFFLGASMFTRLISLPGRAFVLEPFRVSSSAMEPALSIGDQFFAVKVGADSEVRRGDVVAFRRPGDGPEVTWVMRVVGLAGHTIEGRNGVLVVNGVEQATAPCPEPRLPIEELELSCFTEGRHRILLRPGSTRFPHIEPTLVPAGHVFVLGDSRDNSVDSRTFGPLPIGSVKGRASVIFLSWSPGLTLRPERIGLQP